MGDGGVDTCPKDAHGVVVTGGVVIIRRLNVGVIAELFLEARVDPRHHLHVLVQIAKGGGEPHARTAVPGRDLAVGKGDFAVREAVRFGLIPAKSGVGLQQRFAWQQHVHPGAGLRQIQTAIGGAVQRSYRPSRCWQTASNAYRRS